MKLTLVVLVFTSKAILADSVDFAKKNKDTLVLLHVLFRHGERTPDKNTLFPNDQYKNETYKPFGFSQLTFKGKRTEYEIGKYLRKTYGTFIPELYTPDVLYALTTNLKRTKMSLLLVLAGLFPPLSKHRFAPALAWQPIPFSIEEGPGLITPSIFFCPNYITQYYNYVLSREAQNYIAGYRSLYTKLSKHVGFDVQTPRDVGNIYAALKSQEAYGLKLPEWSFDIYPEILEEAAAVDYEFATATSDLKKLSSGFLLKKILDDSLSKKRGVLSEERKLFLYSAHEINIATMLGTLNVFYRHVPPYGATIFFEIHDIKGEYGLKLFYQDYSQPEPKLLIIPNCKSFCPLDRLYELMKDNIPTQKDVCLYSGELL